MASTTSTETLLAMIPSLTAEQQDVVVTFIRYLKEKELSKTITVNEAFEEFVSQHSELLRLLSQ